MSLSPATETISSLVESQSPGTGWRGSGLYARKGQLTTLLCHSSRRYVHAAEQDEGQTEPQTLKACVRVRTSCVRARILCLCVCTHVCVREFLQRYIFVYCQGSETTMDFKMSTFQGLQRTTFQPDQHAFFIHWGFFQGISQTQESNNIQGFVRGACPSNLSQDILVVGWLIQLVLIHRSSTHTDNLSYPPASHRHISNFNYLKG